MKISYQSKPDTCKTCGIVFEDVHASGNVRCSDNPLVCVPCWNSQDFEKWDQLAPQESETKP